MGNSVNITISNFTMATYFPTTESVAEEVAFNIDQAIKKTRDRNHLRRKARYHLNVLILHAEKLETRNEDLRRQYEELQQELESQIRTSPSSSEGSSDQQPDVGAVQQSTVGTTKEPEIAGNVFDMDKLK